MADLKLDISKESIEDLYVNQKLSLSDAALRLDVSPTTIHSRMKMYGIPRREQGRNSQTAAASFKGYSGFQTRRK